MLDVPAAPEAVNLVRHTDGMSALTQTRASLSVSMREMCERADITKNSAQAWLRGERSPSLIKFLPFANAHGYDVVLLDRQGESTSFRDLPACIERINRSRCLMGVGLYEMEYRSGVSIRSFFAWRNEERSPTLANIVALAQTFGLSVIMRRTTP